MNLADPEERARFRARLGEVFAGRKVICGVAPLAAMSEWVALLRSVGAQRPLLLATGRGAGPVPAEDEAGVVMLPTPPSSTMTDELRGHDALVRNLPAHVTAAVEEYDGRGEALWLTGPFIVNNPVLGRPVVGGRPASWAALEDKLVVDEIWDAVGVPRAEHASVSVADGELGRAAARLDRGHGTVWSGDARDGFNGGGDFVRWVLTEREQARARAFFAVRCDRVRVMPFLEGVPCSIHGVVLPDGTAAFRPVELAILRDDRRRFVYGGQGTAWQPPEQDRRQMRELVRRTGEHLRERVGYRGGFGVDGVLTADGFRPTELNPRMSGGLTALARAVDVPLFPLLQANLAAGRDPGVSVEELESWAVPAMDEATFCKAVAVSSAVRVEESRDLPVSWDGERLSPGDGGMSVVVGPTTVGLFARLDTGDRPRPGQRVADLNVALMRLLDEEVGTDFGEVAAPPDVRRS
jgi:hypothetical protein